MKQVSLKITAAEKAARYRGFQVIRDTVEIDETLHRNDSISIEDCFGFVLIEIPKPSAELTREEIFDRAEELAEQSIPYGIAEISWTHTYEAGDAFLRFKVEAWEAITQEQRETDAAIFKADEARDLAREVSVD